MKIKFSFISINRSIALLAFIAALTGMVATFIPSSAPTLSIVSTLSGTASTIISVYQPAQTKLENVKTKTETISEKKDIEKNSSAELNINS